MADQFGVDSAVEHSADFLGGDSEDILPMSVSCCSDEEALSPGLAPSGFPSLRGDSEDILPIEQFDVSGFCSDEEALGPGVAPSDFLSLGGDSEDILPIDAFFCSDEEALVPGLAPSDFLRRQHSRFKLSFSDELALCPRLLGGEKSGLAERCCRALIRPGLGRSDLFGDAHSGLIAYSACSDDDVLTRPGFEHSDLLGVEHSALDGAC